MCREGGREKRAPAGVCLCCLFQNEALELLSATHLTDQAQQGMPGVGVGVRRRNA